MGVDGAHNHRRAEADEKKRSVDGKGVVNYHYHGKNRVVTR